MRPRQRTSRAADGFGTALRAAATNQSLPALVDRDPPLASAKSRPVSAGLGGRGRLRFMDTDIRTCESGEPGGAFVAVSRPPGQCDAEGAGSATVFDAASPDFGRSTKKRQERSDRPIVRASRLAGRKIPSLAALGRRGGPVSVPRTGRSGSYG